MKVLWFANTPCGATEKLTGQAVTGGGWLYALSEELIKVNELDLHIAFYWHQSMSPFICNGITYHPVLQEGEGSRFGRLINRYRASHSDALDKKALPRLKQVVDDVKPDIVHIHGSEGNFGLIATLPLSCPVVLSIQGILSPIVNMQYRGLSKKEILRYESLLLKLAMGGIQNNENTFNRNAEREKIIYKNIPNVIGRTSWDRACSLALNPKREYYEVGEIIRREFYEARWKKENFSSPLILTSTISSGVYKGIEAVFQTASVLKNSGFAFEWNIIGSDKKDMYVRLSEKRVNATAEYLGINLLGRKNAKEIVTLMSDADIYVQVSHIENSPNSLCEAMLLGMPIIATFAGGTASMLKNNVEGRLTQDGEPYSMAGMIMEMASDVNLSKKMGECARETAIKRHNPNFVCKQLVDAYEKIINSNAV